MLSEFAARLRDSGYNEKFRKKIDPKRTWGLGLNGNRA